jgi:hypothetical protein
MKRRSTSSGRSAAMMMWSCVALFAARVVGQLEALLLAPPWLPDMEAWYSGLMPYHLLLPAQIGILMALSATAWNRRVRSGAFARANPRGAAALRIFAGIYFIVMAVRLGVNVIDNGAASWRHGAIPVALHWVLALFVLVAGRAAGSAVRGVWVPAQYRHEDDETDDIPHGDVPAIAQPLEDGLRFGEQVGYGHTG